MTPTYSGFEIIISACALFLTLLVVYLIDALFHLKKAIDTRNEILVASIKALGQTETKFLDCARQTKPSHNGLPDKTLSTHEAASHTSGTEATSSKPMPD